MTRRKRPSSLFSTKPDPGQKPKVSVRGVRDGQVLGDDIVAVVVDAGIPSEEP
jgi:hypothetical protein